MNNEKIANIIKAAKERSKLESEFDKQVFGEPEFFENENGEKIPIAQSVTAAQLAEALERPEYKPVAEAEAQLEQALGALTDNELTAVTALMFYGRDRYHNDRDGYQTYEQALAWAKESMAGREGDIAYLTGKRHLGEYLECGMKHAQVNI